MLAQVDPTGQQLWKTLASESSCGTTWTNSTETTSNTWNTWKGFDWWNLFSDADASKGSNTWVGLDSIGHLSYFMSFGEWWRTWVIFSLKMAFGRFGSYSLHQIAGFMTFYKFLTSPTVMVCAIWYEVHIYGTHGTNITFLYILRNVLLKAQI